ncbi:MAG: hypothetical protein HY049_01205 [Acidobacteria bacterium]|nr:hypothetical protein [Acidobacteriota bacterium]
MALPSAASSASSADPAYQEMRWRLVGPFRGGWATAVAGVASDPATYYFGSADGGVWKTTDAGVTWRSLWSDQGSASIGALAVAPGDANVIWAGTGQIQQRWDVVDGDGVYRSTDAGATWRRVGLADSRHIGAIWVDPRSAAVAVVAATGHAFGANAERGLYRTADGGAHWDHVLDRGPDVGAVDIAGDSALPDVLYASLWQMRRHPWLDYFQPPVGAGSGIVKSIDGGKSWSPVGGQGLPAGPLGRIELAVAPTRSSNRVWAAIHAVAGGGLYRSDDGGGSWQKIHPDAGLASAYTSNLTPDPKDPETLWLMGRSIRVSRDGGRTFQFAKGSPGGDDYHALWISPADSRRMIVGADQGSVVTLNGGETWSSWYNQPTGQFYRLGLDDRFPYWIYSGQQDSGTVGIASRSDYGQITFRDWHPVGGDERDGDVPDPKDPAIVYGAGLGGRISRWNERTGQVQNVAPWPVSSYGARPGTGRYRYEWITPLAISPRPPHAIYTAAQVLFRSLDAGKSWETVSPDLTGADPNATGCGAGDAEVPVDRATACGFGTIFAVTPSPAADGAVWMGTTNGRVLLTRDDSKTWAAVTPKGMADWTKINLIDAPARDAATAYVAADRHRLDDFRPMAWRTHDWGATWVEIGHGLPAGAWVGVVRADPVRPGLLYAGTSRGVWASLDDGESWRSLQLNLPTTGVNDLRVQGNDLVVATEGRAIWILDQVEPLRNAASPVAGVKLLLPARAYRLRGNQNKDTPLPAEEPRGENPPDGAILDYVLPAGVAGPVTLEIADGSGEVVRRFSSDDRSGRPEADVYFTDRFLAEGPKISIAPGHHRFVWNLRYPRPRALEYEYSIAAVPGKDTAALPEGAFVLPGAYRIRLAAGAGVSEGSLDVAMDPRAEVSREPLAPLLEFQRKVGDALSRSTDLERERRSTARLLDAAKDDPKAKALAKSVAQRKADLEKLTAKSEDDPAKLNGNLASLATDLESVDAPPTAPQRELLELCAKGIARFDTAWSAFLAGPFADLRLKLAKIGVKASDK